MGEILKLKEHVADRINNGTTRLLNTNDIKLSHDQQVNLIAGMQEFYKAGDFKAITVAVDNKYSSNIALSQYFLLSAFLTGVSNITVIEDISARYMWSKLNHVGKRRQSPSLLIIDSFTIDKLSKFYSKTSAEGMDFKEFLISIMNFSAVIVIYDFSAEGIISDIVADMTMTPIIVAHNSISNYLTHKVCLRVETGIQWKESTSFFDIINTAYKKGGYRVHTESYTTGAIVKYVEKYKRRFKSKKPLNVALSVNQSSLFLLTMAALLNNIDVLISVPVKSSHNLAISSSEILDIYKRDINLTSLPGNIPSMSYSSRANKVKKNLFGKFNTCCVHFFNWIQFAISGMRGTRIFLTTDIPIVRSKYKFFRRKVFVPMGIGTLHITSMQTKRLKEAMSIWSILHKEYYFLEHIVVILDEELIEVGIKIDKDFQRILNNKRVSLRSISKEISDFLMKDVGVDKMIHIRLITSRVRTAKGVPVPMLSQ